jgi:hypothetical protein
MPPPPREPDEDDRLVQHLLHEVPEVRSAVGAVEWQYGTAAPMTICTRVADVATEAHRDGNDELGLRIVRALAPGLDETSGLYAPNLVSIGFLENGAWHGGAGRSTSSRTSYGASMAFTAVTTMYTCTAR